MVQVDAKLRGIMRSIYQTAKAAAKEYDVSLAAGRWHGGQACTSGTASVPSPTPALIHRPGCGALQVLT